MVRQHGVEQGTALLSAYGLCIPVCRLLVSGDTLFALAVALACALCLAQSTSAVYKVSGRREAGWIMWWVSVPDRLEGATLLGVVLFFASRMDTSAAGEGRLLSSLLFLFAACCVKLCDRLTCSAASTAAAGLEAFLIGAGLLLTGLKCAELPCGLDAMVGALCGLGFTVMFQITCAIYDTAALRLSAAMLAVFVAELGSIDDADHSSLRVWSFAAWAVVAVPALSALNRLGIEIAFFNREYYERYWEDDEDEDNSGRPPRPQRQELGAGTSVAITVGTAAFSFVVWYAMAYAWTHAPFTDIAGLPVHLVAAFVAAVAGAAGTELLPRKEACLSGAALHLFVLRGMLWGSRALQHSVFFAASLAFVCTFLLRVGGVGGRGRATGFSLLGSVAPMLLLAWVSRSGREADGAVVVCTAVLCAAQWVYSSLGCDLVSHVVGKGLWLVQPSVVLRQQSFSAVEVAALGLLSAHCVARLLQTEVLGAEAALPVALALCVFSLQDSVRLVKEHYVPKEEEAKEAKEGSDEWVEINRKTPPEKAQSPTESQGKAKERRAPAFAETSEDSSLPSAEVELHVQPLLPAAYILVLAAHGL